jgi:hypothetical protein
MFSGESIHSTISKDKTSGDSARNAQLLADFGRKLKFQPEVLDQKATGQLETNEDKTFVDSARITQLLADYGRKMKFQLEVLNQKATGQLETSEDKLFVCTVCWNAFAYVKDRNRHKESHYSEDRKYICKGDLKQGDRWGCGRRYALADYFVRHFRSEVGQFCIKPLVGGEVIERRRKEPLPEPEPIVSDAHRFTIEKDGNYTLLAALVSQYPAFAAYNRPYVPVMGQLSRRYH